MQIIRQQNARKLHFFDYSLWNHYVKDHNKKKRKGKSHYGITSSIVQSLHLRCFSQQCKTQISDMQQLESLCKSSVLAVGTFVYKNRCKDTINF